MTFKFDARFESWIALQRKAAAGATNWRAIERETLNAVGQLMRSSVNQLYQQEIHGSHQWPAYASGAYGRDLTVTFSATHVILSANARHAGFLETGTKPHWPPKAAIAEWAADKGLSLSSAEQQAVRMKIAATGTPARKFITRTFQRPSVINGINAIMKAALGELAFAMGFSGAQVSARTGKQFYGERWPKGSPGGVGGRFRPRE